MKRLFLSLGLLLCLAAPLASATVSAYDPLDKACADPAAAQSAGCTGRTATDPISGSNGVLRRATSLIAILAGVAAIIVIIIGGIMYITSGGDPQKAAQARGAIIGSLIGLVIIAVAQGIIIFVLSRV